VIRLDEQGALPGREPAPDPPRKERWAALTAAYARALA
jgi:hypothetical protein